MEYVGVEVEVDIESVESNLNVEWVGVEVELYIG